MGRQSSGSSRSSEYYISTIKATTKKVIKTITTKATSTIKKITVETTTMDDEITAANSLDDFAFSLGIAILAFFIL